MPNFFWISLARDSLIKYPNIKCLDLSQTCVYNINNLIQLTKLYKKNDSITFNDSVIDVNYENLENSYKGRHAQHHTDLNEIWTVDS